MKTIILLYLVTFTSFSLCSQKMGDNPINNEGHFIITKKRNEAKSQILSKGDKITIRLRNEKLVRQNNGYKFGPHFNRFNGTYRNWRY